MSQSHHNNIIPFILHFPDYFDFAKGLTVKYGNFLRVWVANKLELHITDPKFVEVLPS